MKQFFKIVFGSCLGVIVASIVVIGITAIVAKVAVGSDGKADLKPNSVLKISLSNLPERTNNQQSGLMDFDFDSPDVLGVHDVIKVLKEAGTDNNISGILLDLDNHEMGLTQTALLKQALRDFKANDKFVVAYGSNITQSDYLLGVESTKFFVNPLGYLDFRGFGASVDYMKDFFDQIGVKFETYYAGKFKGASEPNRLSQMSPENRLQIRKYLQGIWDAYLLDIASSRSISVEKLNELANTMEIRTPQVALDNKMIDELGYYGDAIDYVKEQLGLEPDGKFNVLSVSAYRPNVTISQYKSGDKIAVIYAEGVISGGEGEPGTITDGKYVKLLRKLRFDEDLKAIVLRVNSPGGSAIASENILQEFKKFKELEIPIVVSMGSVAASGGYYISCAADSIFAEPYTITGSIGVVAQIPIIEELMKEKLKINTDTVLIRDNALSGVSIKQPFNADAKQYFQGMVDTLYTTFVNHVVDARNMDFAAVDEVAQGRVWAANDALAVNLVDKIGGLDDAIASAKTLANLSDDIGISEYPKVDNALEQLLKNLSKKPDLSKALLEEEFSGIYKNYKRYKLLSEQQGPLFLMPYEIEIK